MLWFKNLCGSPAVIAGALMLIVLAGCPSSKPPPSDKATVEKELKQLNDNRQKEWGNK